MSKLYACKSVLFVTLAVFLLKSIVFLTRRCRTFMFSVSLLERSAQLRVENRPFCSPVKSLLFLKTHKTGGSTVTNILYRHAHTRNLTMALPKKQVFSFFWPLDFQLEFMEDLHGKKADILCNHARYKHDVMRALFPTGTPYITILRDPLTRFESSFFYEDYPAFFGIQSVPNPYQYFLERLMNDTKTEKGHILRNCMSFDLGLDPDDFDHREAIEGFIGETARHFDLVLIMEHFDESLALMKRKLCWTLEDVVYVKHNSRLRPSNGSIHIRDTLRQKVLEWNNADVMLYRHFNDTLWKQIDLQDGSFWEEVKVLKEASLAAARGCVSSSTRADPVVKSVSLLTLKENVSRQMMDLCTRLTRSEDAYVEFFRVRQQGSELLRRVNKRKTGNN